MVPFGVLLTYLAAVVAIVLAPGPGQMLILSRCLSGGRRIGVLTSIGLNIGTLVHTIAAALGLSAILATSALAFSVVKFVGAAYLIYLGIRALREPDGGYTGPVSEDVSRGRALWEATVTGVMNPKVAIFFLAFLPQFVRPELGAVFLQFLVLGSLVALVGVLWDVVLVVTVGSLGRWMTRHRSVVRWRQRITQAALIGLGVHLALAGRR